MAECEASYGFLPCSTNLLGSLFLVLVYGYIILQGANTLSEGSELLLEVLDPGLIGGLLLPILGGLPDACIILAAASAPLESIEAEVSVGVGTLAGSTVMLLTIVWGGGLLLGRCNLTRTGRALDRTLTRGWDLKRTGVSTDNFTPLNAVIMVVSVFLYLIIQVPASIFGQGEQTSEAALFGGIACMLCLVGYCAFQVAYPELQKRKIEAAKRRNTRQRAISSLTRQFSTLVRDDGCVDEAVVNFLFDTCDADHSGYIDSRELRILLTTLMAAHYPADAIDIGEEVSLWMKDFDKNQDNQISRGEFLMQLNKWISEVTASGRLRCTGTSVDGADQRPDSRSRTLGLLLQKYSALIRSNGTIDEKVVTQLFDAADSDHSGFIDPRELKILLTTLMASDFSSGVGNLEAEVDTWMKDFDTNQDGQISLEEFKSQLTRWIKELRTGGEDVNRWTTPRTNGDVETPLLENEGEETGDGEDEIEKEEEEEEEEKVPLTRFQIVLRATVLMAAGTAVCAIFSDPLVGSVAAFSEAVALPPFFVSFIITPLASNASELVSSLRFAAKKRVKNISLTFSQVYGAVTMNNTMNLGLFMLLVHWRGLPWTYTSEVIITVGATLLVGLLGWSSTSFQSFWAIPVIAIYPLSLFTVWALDTFLGFN